MANGYTCSVQQAVRTVLSTNLIERAYDRMHTRVLPNQRRHGAICNQSRVDTYKLCKVRPEDARKIVEVPINSAMSLVPCK